MKLAVKKLRVVFCDPDLGLHIIQTFIVPFFVLAVNFSAATLEGKPCKSLVTGSNGFL